MVFNCGLPACKTDALSGAYETPLDMMSRAQQGITVFNFSTLILPVLPKKKAPSAISTVEAEPEQATREICHRHRIQ